VTERSVARHRARHKSGSPLSTLTGSLSIVGDYVGSARRSGVIIAMSSGLVASMALPAHAVNASPVEAAGAQTASIPVIPAAEPAGAAFFAAPEAGLLALPADLASNDVPVVAPAAATVDFDRTAFTAVRPGTLVERIGTTTRQSRRSAGISLTETGDNGQAGGSVATPKKAPSSSSRPKLGGTANVSTGADTSTQTTAAPQASTSGSAVLNVAARYLGVQYRWGGTKPSGFDCSGYTQYVYGVLGKHLPRTVAQQRAAARIIPRSQARVGDLVIFGNSHIGIFAGNGMMYDSPHRGMSVSLRKIYSGGVSFGRV
jgi:peptidoglycan DL-endopeptidase CwlO